MSIELGGIWIVETITDKVETISMKVETMTKMSILLNTVCLKILIWQPCAYAKGCVFVVKPVEN